MYLSDQAIAPLPPDVSPPSPPPPYPSSPINILLRLQVSFSLNPPVIPDPPLDLPRAVLIDTAPASPKRLRHPEEDLFLNSSVIKGKDKLLLQYILSPIRRN